MAESLSTENLAVAYVFATIAALRLMPTSRNNTAEAVSANYKTIFNAIRTAK